MFQSMKDIPGFDCALAEELFKCGQSRVVRTQLVCISSQSQYRERAQSAIRELDKAAKARKKSRK